MANGSAETADLGRLGLEAEVIVVRCHMSFDLSSAPIGI